jgi:hypothetical protein
MVCAACLIKRAFKKFERNKTVKLKLYKVKSQLCKLVVLEYFFMTERKEILPVKLNVLLI